MVTTLIEGSGEQTSRPPSKKMKKDPIHKMITLMAFEKSGKGSPVRAYDEWEWSWNRIGIEVERESG